MFKSSTRFALFTLLIVATLMLCTMVSVHEAKRRKHKCRTRYYYIQAEEVEWDYTPSGRDLMTGEPLSGNNVNNPSQFLLGNKVQKARYIQYTDSTFTTKVPQPKHLGILGPVIRAEVGDRIKVLYRNNATFTNSIHVHGFFYLKTSEGAAYLDGTSGTNPAGPGDAIEPGQTYLYEYEVPERAGPGPDEKVSSLGWMYHSHALSEPAETQSGLMGFIVVTRRGSAKKNGKPKDVDRELFALFKVFDETKSALFNFNVQKYLNASGQLSQETFDRIRNTPKFIDDQAKDSINGLRYHNLKGLVMKKGERVRWYIMSVGSVMDIHPAHWHGNTGFENGIHRTDTVLVGPGQNTIVDMIPDNPGRWMFHCHIDDHIDGGMSATYDVKRRR
ncbi:hypothetical protein FDP41_011798 [Naegleria fowleri]|uniref:Plastocyanin-like domain-containing protein n=1 Tax=Naegleria fowleri TaxID=5763 RepID=A0A6A5BXF0_NAEFO|nr:uncharacterized protein FDP41_011798 [Naegleria fowleri]KAF0981937.1 hypothetical protein FDP41_011798 [Naegleria fowleri]CAG4708741.1 unnamed protein product [Naegleria fowleri]